MRLVVALTLVLASLGAFAQGYPNRPVKLIVAIRDFLPKIERSPETDMPFDRRREWLQLIQKNKPALPTQLPSNPNDKKRAIRNLPHARLLLSYEAFKVLDESAS